MRIVYLTTDDPIYLPAFFERVLDERAKDTLAVHVVPPLYKGQTSAQAAWRYYRTFGLDGVVGLVRRIASAKLRRRSIGAVCSERGVPYTLTRDVNAPEFVARLHAASPDVVVSVSCPQIFKKPLIETPALGCLNIHGAILPQYRGVMPSFWMMANQERQAGVTIYFVNEQIDAGDVCAQRVFDIRPEETLDAFLRRSKRIAADLLLEVLERLESGTVTTAPLNLAEGSYYSWPDTEAVKRFRASGRRLW